MVCKVELFVKSTRMKMLENKHLVCYNALCNRSYQYDFFNKKEELMMTRAMQVYERRKKAMYMKLLNGTDANVKRIFFDIILDVLDRKTENEDNTDMYIFRGETKTTKDFSIRQDGFYMKEEKVLSFDEPVDIDHLMEELKYFIGRHDGFYAIKNPYKHFYDEKLTYYLQIGMK